jgi:hypothetical protein
VCAAWGLPGGRVGLGQRHSVGCLRRSSAREVEVFGNGAGAGSRQISLGPDPEEALLPGVRGCKHAYTANSLALRPPFRGDQLPREFKNPNFKFKMDLHLPSAYRTFGFLEQQFRHNLQIVICVQTTTLVAALFNFRLSKPSALSLTTALSLSLVANPLSRERSLSRPDRYCPCSAACTASAAIAYSMSHHILNKSSSCTRM